MRRALRLLASLVALATSASARDYYFHSERGDDRGAGTREAPYRTLGRLARIKLQPGDRILLNRGGTFRDRLILRGVGTRERPIRVTPWGEGPRPEILGSIRVTDWRLHKGEVYKAEIAPKRFGGHHRPFSVYQYDPGRVPVRLLREKAIPAERGRFFYDGKAGVLYVRTSDGRPPSDHRIEVPVLDQIGHLNGLRWVEIDNLTILFANCRHIVLRDCRDVTIRDCASLFVGWYGNPNICILEDSARVRVERCFLYENINCGILLSSGANNCRIADCTIVKCAGNDGVTIHSGGRDALGFRHGFAGDHNIIENNVIALCPEESVDVTSGDFHIVRNNICYGNGNPGIIVGHDSDHVLIENNICFANRHAGIMVGGQPKEGSRGRCRVVGNLCYGNVMPGVEVGQQYVEVVNNTLVNSMRRPTLRITAAKSWGALVRNNLILTLDPAIRYPSFHTIYGDPAMCGLRMDHNLVYHAKRPIDRLFRTWRRQLSPEQFVERFNAAQDTIVAEPKLARVEERYYFLAPDSPAVNAGEEVGRECEDRRPDMGWKELGDEASAPKYPPALITGREDEATILWLWGKRAGPPEGFDLKARVRELIERAKRPKPPRRRRKRK